MGGRCRRCVRRREIGGNPGPAMRRDRRHAESVSAGQRQCGRDRIRTCEGNAGDFTGRTVGSSRVPSHPHLAPPIAGDVHKRPVNSFRGHSASCPLRHVPRGQASGGGKVEGNPGRRPTRIPHLSPAGNARPPRVYRSSWRQAPRGREQRPRALVLTGGLPRGLPQVDGVGRDRDALALSCGSGPAQAGRRGEFADGGLAVGPGGCQAERSVAAAVGWAGGIDLRMGDVSSRAAAPRDRVG
jgi:hypothetical protein